MRIGLPLDMSKPVSEIVEQARGVADAGFPSAFASQIFGPDTLTVLAVVGAQVPDLRLVTSVVPTWPRHPVMLAAQALTVQAVTGGRLTLGIGLSHQIVIETVFGIPFTRPVDHMRDYLAILQPLLHGEQVTHAGDSVSATTFGPLEVTAPAPEVLVAALGPRMLALAGSEADGTATWMTGPSTLEAHIIPSITAAATEAGRRPPTIAAGLPISVTGDPDGARAQAAQTFAVYGTLPSYRAMLEREGAASPGDVAVVGDEAAVAAQVRHLAAIGVTDFQAFPFGSADEVATTVALLAQLRTDAAVAS
jgi:5,10-methylenetetrahydromethanopterin reductase